MAATGCAPHIHSGAENDLFVVAGDALNKGGFLCQQLVENVFLDVLGGGLFFLRLPRGLRVRIGRLQLVRGGRDCDQSGRRRWKARVAGHLQNDLFGLVHLVRNREFAEVQFDRGHMYLLVGLGVPGREYSNWVVWREKNGGLA